MLSDELKELIAASLVDGVLTPGERAILLKRAMLEGVDADEANLLIDAELQKIKLQKQANAPKVHKCPACGEILPALTGICPSCGNVVENNTSDHELNFLIEQMTRGLAQLMAATAPAPTVVATLEEHRRRAMMLYGDHPKVQMLAKEIKEEIDEYRRLEAEDKKVDNELKRLEAEAKIEAAKHGGRSRGGGSDSLISTNGCQKGCLIGFIIFLIIGIFAVIEAGDDDEKADKQYTELVGRLDSLKAEPITIENYLAKENAVKDMMWVENNEYSTHEKNKRDAFDKLLDNYIDQLSTFYALHHKKIDAFNGYMLHDLSKVEEAKEEEETNKAEE